MEVPPNTVPENSSNRRRILFVDDDQEFLQTVERLMRLWSKDSWDVLTAPGAHAAMAILQEQLVNLLVIDVCMPVVDGLQFLSVAHRRYPDVQKIMLTGFATEAYRSACLGNGAELFLEKPKTTEGMESIFGTINELMRWTREPGFRGVIRGVELLNVIQMECLGRSSSVLGLSSQKISGRIFIKEGAIVHAETGELNGEEAFYRLFQLESGDFRLNPFTEPAQTTITSTWESLLMQAAHIRDENAETAEAEKAASSSDRNASLPTAMDTNAAIAATGNDAKVEEFLICSAAGDVLHAWQCPNTEFRINFLEFLLQKARLLQNALQLGDFDRVEFNGNGERLLAQVGGDRGVMIRTSSADTPNANNSKTRLPGGPPSASRRSQAQQWFEQRLQLPGLLAAGLQFGDRSGLNHSLSPNFAAGGLETLRRCAAETFQVLNLQRFKGNHTRWSYTEIVIECAQWADATCLALVLARQTLDLDSGPVTRLIAEFLHEGETTS